MWTDFLGNDRQTYKEYKQFESAKCNKQILTYYAWVVLELSNSGYIFFKFLTILNFFRTEGTYAMH